MRPTLLACTLLLATLVLPATAQVNQKKYEGYFLVGQFGEICTMCEAVVLCEAAAAPIEPAGVPATGSFTLYHIHTRTFWSQVSTIWEWFVANFSTASLAGGHERPVTVHGVEDGLWSAPREERMRVSLEPALLRISDGLEIERRERRWRRSEDQFEIGYCARLPLWDAIGEIERRATGSPGHD